MALTVHHGPGLVVFLSTPCAAAQLLHPRLQQLALDYPGTCVVRVRVGEADADGGGSVASARRVEPWLERLRVRRLPALVASPCALARRHGAWCWNRILGAKKAAELASI